MHACASAISSFRAHNDTHAQPVPVEKALACGKLTHRRRNNKKSISDIICAKFNCDDVVSVVYEL